MILWNILIFFFFFFNDTATTEIYTLSLHDALPIFFGVARVMSRRCNTWGGREPANSRRSRRSEEHTSELPSQSNLVCRLLLEKKKNYTTLHTTLLRNPSPYKSNYFTSLRVIASLRY